MPSRNDAIFVKKAKNNERNARNEIIPFEKIEIGMYPPQRHLFARSRVGDSDHSLRKELRNTRLRIDELECQVEKLNQQLAHARAEIDSKDSTIELLRTRLEQEDEHLRRNENLQTKLNEYWKSRSLGKDACTADDQQNDGDPYSAESGKGEVENVVDEIQRWLFMEGGNLRGVESLLTEYCHFCRSVGMPLDRLFIAGMMLHPQISAYVWKWEIGEEFNEHEVPHSAFEKPNYNPNEPFAVLLEGRAMEYRMNADDTDIPPDCSWFKEKKYQDYFALPIYYRGVFVGAMAWCTKTPKGFSQKHIDIFHQSLAALSTVLRLHTNDIVLKTLMGRLQEEVNNQTKELSKANIQLEEANKQVVTQSRTQLKYFAMMSHEIRTPLNGIVGMSNLLLEGDLPKHIRESIQTITCSADLLAAVVNDILDYSKLIAGKVETEIVNCKILQCLNPVLESTRVRAEIRRLELRTKIAADMPLIIKLDGRRLQQILYNLLGNAIKFGECGKYIDFQADVVDADMAKGEVGPAPSLRRMLRISVKDYGKGIMEDDLVKVFEPFQQASTNDPAVGGTGLGLAITSQLVNAMGGTIFVNSEYGKSCEFVVKLPFVRSAEALQDTSYRTVGEDSSSDASFETIGEKASTATADAGRPAAIIAATRPSGGQLGTEIFENIKVLVAEDNSINQKVLHLTLQRLGIQTIVTVDNGLKALEASASSEFDVILMVRTAFGARRSVDFSLPFRKC